MAEINSISSNYLSGVSEKLQNINKQLKELPSVLNPDTLEKLQNGEYEVTLKEYTDMNTYRTMMTALYGNSSANRFNSALGRFLGLENNRRVSAKEFMNALENKGVSQGSALKLYTAMKTYSSMSYLISGQRNSFVSAKI